MSKAMPRRKRVARKDHYHHIMFRGVNGENIFKDDRDKAKLCLLLQESCEKQSVHIHGFCFMSNHIHLILEPKENVSSLQLGIHSFAFRYAQYFNKRHERRGYLFQGRFKSILVEDGAYLKRLIRYVHLNPVEANIVSLPEQYKWSSYRAYLEHDHYVWLHKDRVLKRFGETREKAIESFVKFTCAKLEFQSDLEEISKAFQKGIFGDKELNKIDFLLNDEKDSDITEKSFETINQIIKKVCTHFDISISDLKSQSKQIVIVNARALVALIVRRSNKWSLEDLGRLLNKNSGTLSRLASKAETQPHLIQILNELYK